MAHRSWRWTGPSRWAGALPRAAVVALPALLLVPPAEAGAPYTTDDPDSPEKGHFEINVAAQFTRNKAGWTGNLPGVEVNYGVTDRFQVSLMLPLAFSRITGGPSNAGLGDAEIGLKYRFFDADDWGWRPALAFAPVLTVPTGNARHDLGSGRTAAFLPLWLSKEFNQWTVFGGGGYNINPGLDRKNWWFAGIGVTRELDPQWTIGMELYHATPAERGQADSTGMNVGAVYNISDTHHILFSLGRNLTHTTENNSLSGYVGYQLTF